MKTAAAAAFLKRHQQSEVNSWLLYEKIAYTTKSERERDILLSISRDEKRHADIFGQLTGQDLKPNRLWVALHVFAKRLFGYTFIIKQLERAEDKDIRAYRAELERIPELGKVMEDEQSHEKLLTDMLDEERLRYAGDMVLGMNDALVELTGALAGYTLAMQNTRLVAMAGLITGISATLSMTASGYLSSREEAGKNALKSSAYTGLAYLVTVALLIVPYLLFPAGSYFYALGTTLVTAVAIIAAFNYYLAVSKGRSFRKSFLTMAVISLGVAAVSFVVGIVVKRALGIEL
jgi:VIT1/CCC1 family predicted Fe2+/Mn2+ transporter